MRAVFGVAGAAALVLSGIGAVPATAQSVAKITPVQRERLTGTWQLTGTDGGNPVAPIAYFHPDHTLDFTAPDGSFDAKGRWQENRGGKFAFNQSHFIDDSSGNPQSWITANVTGRQTGDHLIGSGRAKLYDLQGNLMIIYIVKFQGDRTSVSDQPTP